jgi:hypothetical protein
VDRHLDGRRGWAFALGAGAALLRPEVWPFLGLYGLVLWRSDPALRRLVVAGGLAVLALWFLPEWWGSGEILRSAERANDPLRGSLAYADQPALEVLDLTRSLLIAPVWAAALVGAAAFRAQRAVLAIAAGACAWVGLIMLMTTAGFSGNPRYLLLAGGLAAVVAGMGVAALVGAAEQRAAALGAAALVAVVALSVPFAAPRVDTVADQMSDVRSQRHLDDQLEQLVDRLGGRAAVLACGRPTSGRFERPIMASTLRLHLRQVAFRLDPGAPGYVFRTRGRRRPDPALPRERYRTVARLGAWEAAVARCRTRVHL